MTNEKDPDEIFAESKENTRHTTNPDTNGSSPALEDAILQAIEDVDAGDRPQNLTVRDEKLAALFGGLEDADRLDELMICAAEQIGADPPEKVTRANALRMVIRTGLVESAPDLLETSKDARDRFEDSNDVL
jgi:hypothetical protein